MIPHRPPMLLIERVVEHGDEGIVCEGRVPTPSPLADGDTTTPALGIELAAQAAAVLGALDAGDEPPDSPAIGYLASVRSARFHVASLPAGVPLRAIVRRTGGLAGLTLYEAEVTTSDGDALVSTSFGTMRGES
ncbi:MAG: 3-hydroxylacyl-ACP dehydratase [Acidobacteriota bacterium]